MQTMGGYGDSDVFKHWILGPLATTCCMLRRCDACHRPYSHSCPLPCNVLVDKARGGTSGGARDVYLACKLYMLPISTGVDILHLQEWPKVCSVASIHNYIFQVLFLFCIIIIRRSRGNLVFLFVVMGWSLLPNALRPFMIYCAPPNLGITRTWICWLKFSQRPIFSGLRFFNEPEISDSGPPA